MSEDISRFGTGERGTFKVEAPKPERPIKVNQEMLNREIERGSWYWNKEKELIEPYTAKQKAHVHFIQTDTINPVESYATDEGKVFDSRSALDRHYKEHGFERVAREDIKPKFRAPKAFNPREHREQWEQAENDVRWGNVELTEWEKEVCRRENEMMENWKNGSRPDHLAKKMQEH